ncbi:ABC transporter substrate-binding protein [Alkalispirochaeta sphaeroplastigenens]|uniref:ABC transporter substrate-binding protein n=1 Tax=Alkalispirochaeta sphaeroplastigenens TaxID=1187066 RepID=A0A2S4JR79_9SPIO|nr:ABC transporter substrate-binding protein [Alkalispirochaeta sphaeroplastigenens]POR02039.1 ABC transporter substrate-binding protein [Alkalispirochaeta sphaeroplastigenens]
MFRKIAVSLLAGVFLFSAVALFAGGQAEKARAADVDYTDNPWTEGQDLSGKTVRIFGAFVDEDARRFNRSMEIFKEATGINVVYEGSGDFESLITVRVEGGSPPDMAAFPQPGLLSDFVKGGQVIDLNQWFSQDYLEQQYDQSWLDMATMDGIMSGFWHRANVKSLVWYPKKAWDAAGYQIPETWDELIALSDQIVADGGVPWSIGIESAGATGWPGTDWIEDILLRIAPVEVYDNWVEGKHPFNSPEVKRAFEIMSEIWFNEDYVLGGTDGIVLTPFGDAPNALFTDPPSAWMHRQASFIPAFFPRGVQVGVDADFFYLPPIDEEFGRPVLGAGDIYGVFNDRPEVRALARYMTQGISTKAWVQAGGFVSPHADADLSWYPTEADRRYAEIIANADTFRFDGSDLMPGPVGAGSFWTEITDYVNNYPNVNLERTLQNIDNSWPGR